VESGGARGPALGVAERLLALEAAVAALAREVQALRAAGGTTTGGTAGAGKTAAHEQGESDAADPPAGGSGAEQLEALLGNARLAAVLVGAGYGSPAAVAAAGDDDLLEIDGVGARALRVIREKVRG
jgi:predicted flap endonuclease-1-like 5' DNA nuclease